MISTKNVSENLGITCCPIEVFSEKSFGNIGGTEIKWWLEGLKE
jgi:hypothetical protein